MITTNEVDSSPSKLLPGRSINLAKQTSILKNSSQGGRQIFTPMKISAEIVQSEVEAAGVDMRIR